jgi:hypothetical protein
MGFFFWVIGTVFFIYDVDILYMIATSIVARMSGYNTEREEEYFNKPKSQGKKVRSSDRDIEGAGNESSRLVDDDDDGNLYPLVVCQLPMYNEDAYCEVVIQHCCNIDWPR